MAGRVGPRVCIDQLPGRGDADFRVIKRERVLIFHEVEKVGVAAAELFLAIYPECIIPDDPTAQIQADIAMCDDLQLGGEFVTDRQPEGSPTA